MGIYIEGMEMPQTGAERCIVIHGDGRITTFVGAPIDYAKATPVPDHGRLIDADNIGLTNFEIILCQKGNPFKNALEMLLEKIESAPTVIPADVTDTNVGKKEKT